MKNNTQKITLIDQQFFIIWVLNKLLLNFELRMTPFGLITESLDGTHNSILTTDIKKVFNFIKLDVKLYTTLMEPNKIFKQICDNTYFNQELLKMDVTTLKAGSSGFRRLGMQFKNYLIENRPTDKYFFSNCKDVYYDVLDTYFDLWSGEFEILEPKLQANAEKFNGNLVTQWTGILPSEALGLIISKFKEPYGYSFDIYIQNASKEQIKKDLLACVKRNLVM